MKLENRQYFSDVVNGLISGRSGVNKWGAAPSGVQITPTDIWDLADNTGVNAIWLAPTAPRIHTIQSTSAEDAPGGTGVATVIVYYLPDWDTPEKSEIITGDLSAGIAMNEEAVIIHRMKTHPQSTTTNVGANVGTITATAAVDATVTAAIQPGNGQTEMAIYGIPSTHDCEFWAWDVQIDKQGGLVATVDFIIRVNPNPDVQTVAFLRKGDISLQSTGSSEAARVYKVPKYFEGPCIIKIQGKASSADIDAEAGFQLVLIDKR